MIIPKNPRRKIGIMSFLYSFENFSGFRKRRRRNTMQTIKRRMMVRLTEESSVRPIFINGKASAQKIIVGPIMK